MEQLRVGSVPYPQIMYKAEKAGQEQTVLLNFSNISSAKGLKKASVFDPSRLFQPSLIFENQSLPKWSNFRVGSVPYPQIKYKTEQVWKA